MTRQQFLDELKKAADHMSLVINDILFCLGSGAQPEIDPFEAGQLDSASRILRSLIEHWDQEDTEANERERPN